MVSDIGNIVEDILVYFQRSWNTVKNFEDIDLVGYDLSQDDTR